MNRNLLGNLEGKTPDVSNNNGCQRQGRGMLGLFLVAFFALFLNGKAVAQTPDYSGTYYIGSNGYVAGNTTTNYYLCPTEGWAYLDTDGNLGTVTGVDNGKPFLTTYQCRNGVYDANKAVWTIVKAPNSDYYYIIQASTGRYMLSNGPICGNPDRARVHLEEISNPNDLGDKALFNIYLYSGHLVIRPMGITDAANLHNDHGNHKWLTVNQGNQPTLVGTNHKTDGPAGFPNTGGIIGIYTENDVRADFYLDPYTVATPSISFNDATNEITITCENVGADMYYTTDGSEPDLEHVGGTYPTQLYNPESLPQVTLPCTVKAVAVKYDVLSETASTTIITNANISLEFNTCTYTGLAQTPNVTSVSYLSGSESVVIDPSEYSVSYSNNINVGTATVTVNDNPGGSYFVSGSTTFTITPMSIGNGGDPVPQITIDVRKISGNYVVTVKHGAVTLTENTDYTWTINGEELVTVTGMGNYTGSATAQYVADNATYYALHSSTKGYITRISDDATLNSTNTFRYENSFASDNNGGSSIWLLTPEGYLQSDYYYLNVANNQTLYLSVDPKTMWDTEDIGGGKKHLKINNGTEDLFLCNDNNSIALKATTSTYYNACPLDIDEVDWSAATADPLTVQSPQQVTYLRNCYFTQTIHYSFVNDAGTSVTDGTDDGVNRRVFVRLSFKESSDANYGTLWKFDQTNGIIYLYSADSEVKTTATYYLKPADPIVRASHPYEEKTVEFTLQPKPFTPIINKEYLLYSIGGNNNNFRYPKDNNDIPQYSPVSPNGKGGTGTDSNLTDPDTDLNKEISWKLVLDEMGYYAFQNDSTGRYLYYDETAHASSDYGTLKVGATTLPTDETQYQYKFRLYTTTNDNFGTCYYIIPFSKQFAVWKSDGLMSSNYVYAVLNVTQYSGQTTPVVSIYKTDNSMWCIYKYEAEYRVKNDFTITGPASTNTTSNNTFTSSGWYAKCIVESPATGNQQTSMVISGSYYTALPNLNYMWSVEDLDDIINPNPSGDGTSSFTITVEQLPALTASGTIQLQLKGGPDPDNNYILSDPKTFLFTIYGNGSYELQEIHSLAEINNQFGAYQLAADANVAYSESNKPSVQTFSGILDCNGLTVTNLTAPLFTTLNNGRVYNLNLKGVNISGNSGPTGAIAGTANGSSRIYNCGILPTGSIGSSDSYCGGLVGLLSGSARVINCFSYATVTGGTTVGGLVGYNNYASTMNDLRTMVVNCMFYGDITGGSTKCPVYGGNIITNNTSTGINNYNYFCETATFDNEYDNIDQYNNSWPAEERFLTRFEYYRSILNSNRRLCTWWVNGATGVAPTDVDVAAVGIAKWVLDPSIAPYPILKPWGKYPSVINQDPDQVWDETSQEWKSRDNLPAYQGKKLGTLTVTVKAGSNNSGASDKTLTLPILDMDTLHHDYCYAKVQLPYYNEQFGNPEATTHAEKYGNNYTDKVVTGWKITSVTGGTSGTFDGSSDHAWEDGYNFADRYCTGKDLYSVSNRVFAQGGYYYVPEGVTAITIEAYWGKAVYLQNGGKYLDRVNLAADAFSPAGTMPNKFPNPNGQTVYNSIATAISKLQTESEGVNVYDQAVVLVSNYQFKNLKNQGNLGWNNTSSSDFANYLRPFTWTCVDLDFDNEPDYCLELQYGSGTTRVNIHPVRFDFIPIPDLGLAIKQSSNPYGCGIFMPRGHFEITETAFMHTNQFEYDGHGSYKKETAPLILNGGQYEQIVTTVDTWENISKHTNYIIIGGHVWMKKFTPGSHITNSRPSRLCAVSVLGAEFQEFYLTGMFRADISTNVGNPHCYTNGGRFGLMAGAGMEQVNGDVTFKIDHSIVDEFYGGGINSDKPVKGSIHVTIDNSLVGYYCGGPKTGNMETGTEVVTTATGTTFGTFFGGGNGGNNLTRTRLWDNTNPSSGQPQSNLVPSDWDSSAHGHFGEFNPFTYVNAGVGYHAQFEFELMNNSGGDNDNVVARTYRWDAQFSMTTVQKVTSTLTDCHVKKEFYGGGNLSPVNGDVLSTLDNTRVDGSAFGAGFSSTIPSFSVHDKTTTVYPSRDFAGICHPGSLEYQKDGDVVRLYTWIDDAGLQELGVTGINTSNPYFYSEAMGKWYCYTGVELTDLGSVVGNSTIIVKGNSVIHGSVFGGGDESAVLRVLGGDNGNTLVKILDQTKVFGNIYGGGNIGKVEGNTKVIINGTMPTP